MDIQKHNNSKYYTPSLEPFESFLIPGRLQLILLIGGHNNFKIIIIVLLIFAKYPYLISNFSKPSG
jgi:hypothetical protein